MSYFINFRSDIMNCSNSNATLPIELEENPFRAVWLAVSALIIMCFASFFSTDIINQTAIALLFYFMSGCALYLVTRRGVKYKIYAGAILVIASLFLNFYITYVFSLFRNIVVVFKPISFIFFINFSIIIFVTGIVFQIIFKTDYNKDNKKQILLLGLIGAGAFIIYAFIYGISTNHPRDAFFLNGYSNIISLIPNIILAAFLFLSIIAVYMICNIRSYKIQTTAGHKVWFSLCIIISTIVLIAQTVIEIMGMPKRPGYALIDNVFILFVLTSLGIIGYIKLLASKRTGYLIILMSIGFIFFTNLQIGIFQLIRPLPLGKLNASAFGDIALSFTVLINPFITSMTLLNAWKTTPNELLREKPKVSAVFKIFSIAGLVISFAIFIISSLIIYGRFAFSSPDTNFFPFVVIGAALATLQYFCVAACFNKVFKAPKGLLITGLVFTIISLLFLGAVINILFELM